MHRVALVLLLTLMAPSVAGVACELVCTRPQHQGIQRSAEDCHQRDDSRPNVVLSASLACHGDADHDAVVLAVVTAPAAVSLVAPHEAAAAPHVIVAGSRSLTRAPARPSSSTARPATRLRI